MVAVVKRLKTLEKEYGQNAQIGQDIYTRNKVLLEEIKTAKGQIARMEKMTAGWHITDHALLRYIERKYKLPIDAVKKEILEIVKDYNLGDSDNCMGFVVKGNAIVTYRSKKE